MASYGASMNYVIALGQVFMFLVLLKALKDNGISKGWVSGGLALLLIVFATWSIRTGTCAASTCYGGIENVVFGIGSSGLGLFGTVAGWTWYYIWRLGVLVLLGLGLW